MKSLFLNTPEAISNIQEIVDKIEIYTLARDVLLPKFDIPQEFFNPEDIIGTHDFNIYAVITLNIADALVASLK